uniref:Prephenate dehydrogenase n=1 Tax=Lygus hesperus TaxID=30085 RepID=A0A0A9YEL1_LYGHE
MDLDFDVDGTNTHEVEGSEEVQGHVSIVLVHNPNEVDAQNKSQNEENMVPQLKELTCTEELIETSRREEEKVPEEKNNTSVFDERSFILVRFKKNKGEVEHICRVQNILPDGCLMVILMRPVSRIGGVYNEDLKDQP